MEELYQTIYKELKPYFTKNWSEVVMYFEYSNASYYFEFYEKVKNKYIKCFDIKSINIQDLNKSFEKIFELLTRKPVDKRTFMTIVISKDLDMDIHFDYLDISKSIYMYKQNWKNSYLKVS